MTEPPRKALVTGAAHRIGAAIATDLAAHGYDIAIHANASVDAAQALADALAQKHHVRTAVVQGDLADAAAVADIVPAAIDRLGGLTLLVNNASLFSPDEADDFGSPLWRKHMAVNAEAPARLISAMAAQPPLEVARLAVNIIDQRVFKPTPRYFSYSASKAALHWVTRTMAQALAPHTRVNGLGPGPVLKATTQDDSDFDELVTTMPLQRSPAPSEFADAIRFLADAPSITGQMIAIDAGQHIAWQTPDALIKE